MHDDLDGQRVSRAAAKDLPASGIGIAYNKVFVEGELARVSAPAIDAGFSYARRRDCREIPVMVSLLRVFQGTERGFGRAIGGGLSRPQAMKSLYKRMDIASGQGLLQSMVEEGTLGFALLTQAAGWELGVTLPPQSSASLTGWQEACEVAFGDGRGVNVHAARRRW
jgi:hypothetical protein